MAVTIRYEPNNADFAKLMMADQTQDLALAGARRGAEVARTLASSAGLSATYVAAIRAEVGPPRVLGRNNPRRTARTVAEHRLAATFEFGSGIRSGGNDGRGKPRPQGGYSDPHRILGRAGTQVGSPPRGT